MNDEARKEFNERMVNGYKEMAALNLEIANEEFYAENEAMVTTEEFLK